MYRCGVWSDCGCGLWLGSKLRWVVDIGGTQETAEFMSRSMSRASKHEQETLEATESKRK